MQTRTIDGKEFHLIGTKEELVEFRDLVDDKAESDNGDGLVSYVNGILTASGIYINQPTKYYQRLFSGNAETIKKPYHRRENNRRKYCWGNSWS